MHVRLPFNEDKQCKFWEASSNSKVNEKLYTRKEIVMYIPAIQKLLFHLENVHIRGTHHFGNRIREAFNNFAAYQYLL